MKKLQRNLNGSAFVVWEMKRNVSVVRFKFGCNILISGKIIKDMPVSVASGTHWITYMNVRFKVVTFNINYAVRWNSWFNVNYGSNS